MQIVLNGRHLQKKNNLNRITNEPLFTMDYTDYASEDD